MQNPTIALGLLIEHTRFEILVWGCGAWFFGCLSGRWGLLVGFLLLWCSALFAVGCLSSLCLFFVSCLYVLGDGALMGWGLSGGLDVCVS